MVDIACGTEGRIEDLANIIIGGDSGRLRLVNI